MGVPSEGDEVLRKALDVRPDIAVVTKEALRISLLEIINFFPPIILGCHSIPLNLLLIIGRKKLKTIIKEIFWLDERDS